MPRVLIVILSLFALAAAAPSLAAAEPTPAVGASGGAPGINVVGNGLTTDAGAPLHVAGVNRSGSEYACAEGWGIFDGATDDTSIAAMQAWGINAVRVPLNEDCWLGINGVPSAYAGASYQDAIHDYVNRLLSAGMDVILDLHWGAPGAQLALGQEQAPDLHAVDFWSSVAAQFKGTAGIAYDLFNEPHDISWDCWLNGCVTSAGWQAVGMQQLIDAVRAAGATQPVITEGLNWGGDLSGWLAYEPTDPAHQLVAGWHIYDYSGCNTASCWDSTVAPVARQVPVLATEVGETDCAGDFLDTLLPWADAHGIGYLAWGWDTGSCAGGPSLISDYDGTPTAFGAAYRSLIATTSGTASAPAPTSAPATTPAVAPATTPAVAPATTPAVAPATAALQSSQTLVPSTSPAPAAAASPAAAKAAAVAAAGKMRAAKPATKPKAKAAVKSSCKPVRKSKSKARRTSKVKAKCAAKATSKGKRRPGRKTTSR